MAGMPDDPARIVRFWHAVEMFSPQRWGDHVPDGPEYAETVEPEQIQHREKSAPWADVEFTAARTELFLAALALHKALILAEASTFRRNLAGRLTLLGPYGRFKSVDALQAALDA